MELRLVEFVQRLRLLGLPIGVDQAVSFAESFAWIQPLSRGEVYHADARHPSQPPRILGPLRSSVRRVLESLARTVRVLRRRRRRLATGPKIFSGRVSCRSWRRKAKRQSKEIEVTDRNRDRNFEVEWLQRKDFAKLTEDELRAHSAVHGRPPMGLQPAPQPPPREEPTRGRACWTIAKPSGGRRSWAVSSSIFRAESEKTRRVRWC